MFGGALYTVDPGLWGLFDGIGFVAREAPANQGGVVIGRPPRDLHQCRRRTGRGETIGSAHERDLYDATVSAMLSPRIEPQLRAWFQQFRPVLLRHFRKRGAGANAEDLVQDVFVRLQRGAEHTSIDNIEGYIFRIAHNVLMTHYRQAQLEGAPFSQTLEDKIEAQDSLSPEQILVGREYWARFLSSLEGLPPRAREAFVLHRFDEISQAAIAQRMGISVSAVEKLVGRALAKINADLAT